MIITKQKKIYCKEMLRRKISLSMKLISTIMLLFIMQLSVQAKSQSKITLKFKNVWVKTNLEKIIIGIVIITTVPVIFKMIIEKKKKKASSIQKFSTTSYS
jgi:hypothetical protein